MVGSLAFVVVATVAQVLRQTGTPMWQTVWAEDGATFYKDALDNPLGEVVLRSYAGYGHALPRILADIGTWLPGQHYSKWTTLSAAGIVALLALFVYWASRPLLGAPLRRAVLAGSVFLLPVLPFEVLGVICNLHWILPVACLFAVLLPVDRPWPIVARLFVVVLGPLSSPLCLAFAPIAALQLVAFVVRRRRGDRSSSTRTLVVPIAYLLSCLGQLAIYATATATPAKREVPLSTQIDAITRLYPTKVITNTVFGVRTSSDLWEPLGYWLVAAAVVIVAALLVVKFLGSNRTARLWMGALVVGGAGLFVYSMLSRPAFIEEMVQHTGTPYNFIGARYEVFPAFLLIIALLLPPNVPKGLLFTPGLAPEPAPELTPEPEREPRREPGAGSEPSTVGGPAGRLVDRVAGGLPWKGVALVSLVWVAVAVVPSYRLATYRSGGPSWPAEFYAAEQRCEVPAPAETEPEAEPAGETAAPGREIVVISPGEPWGVSLACADLGVPGDSRGG